MEEKLLNPLDVMQECAQLALLGKGYTKTNPVVGAIVANQSEILSRGWHMAYGGPHAEVNAIDSCPVSTEGLDLYVTLEPCSHSGKTPPCVEKIVKSGIRRVFIGVVDPNPLVAGKGVEYLKNHGVEVYVGYMEDLCASIIEDFVKFITEKKPYYTFKTAQTLDGKIASSTGDSKWISSEASRTYTHYMRAVSDAILVGVNTVIADDPELNVRMVKSDRDPFKIVLDPKGRMPLDRKLVENSADKLIYVTCAESRITEALRNKGADVITLGGDGSLDLNVLSDELVERSILNVMIEGGGTTAGKFFDAGLVDKVNIFIAMMIMGGSVSSVGGNGVENVAQAYKLKEVQSKHFEGDLMISGKITDYKTSVLDLTEKVRGCCACGCGKDK
ncbi:riboflavin biosynthesis protein RibD [Denitrovibrio acetiphilus DSM 12809]|uniref:Riboflavin biosynthesis protein RibD n=1 Tax=Denitrovibrio acetiphilus (strain DSM 12809 / NBRC 114555 / N2460) TaxID=522772 RepID=D4H7U6_DENA2|nr:bifunctional diaminohydroxyphosphoribosylaminopyrimidine deaminase/5-amino-6-(5-phosphoribosylamino)uracil reductase RibD [Denitrovibrio acetiphilus]ADD68095.1 riboflavin biosynthesis protein RibD [Denitrovibrio acetiphilus DSM 12809]